MRFSLCVNPLKRIGGRLAFKRVAKGKGKDKTRQKMAQMRQKMAQMRGNMKSMAENIKTRRKKMQKLQKMWVEAQDTIAQGSHTMVWQENAIVQQRDEITRRQELAELDMERIAQQAEKIQLLSAVLRAVGYAAQRACS